jgi:hypothetical protein
MNRNSTAVWVSPSLLGSRLDGNFNRPTAVAARAKIIRHGNARVLKELTRKIACGPFGSTLTASEQNPDGEVVLIQPTDVSDGGFTLQPGWRITESTLREKELPLYPSGTLLFARKGIYPHCAVLPDRIGKATLGSSMIGVIVNDEVADPYYLEAFFRGATGREVLFSLQMITASPTIGTGELAEAMIPYTDLFIQRAIGNKVRATESLRTAAEEAIKSSIQEIENALGWPVDLGPAQWAFANPASLNARIDPLPYLPRYTTARQLIDRHSSKSFREMGVVAVNGCEIRNFVPDVKPYLLVGDLQ